MLYTIVRTLYILQNDGVLIHSSAEIAITVIIGL
jgi:hypothetical protein